MKVRRDGWLVQWAYLTNEGEWRIPDHTTVCALFWRMVWSTVVVTFFCAVVLGAAYMATVMVIGISLEIWRWSFAGRVWASLLGSAAIIALFVRTAFKPIIRSEIVQLVGAQIKSTKSHICPIVDIVDDKAEVPVVYDDDDDVPGV